MTNRLSPQGPAPPTSIPTWPEAYGSRWQPGWRHGHFCNPEAIKRHTAWDLIKWGISGNRSRWPRQHPSPPGPSPPAQAGPAELRYTVINHATVLLQTGGLNLLTDPIWSSRPSPLSWAGPRRVIPPGLDFDQLPRIDLVLLTHNHYDHMDIPTLKRLARRDNPLLLAGRKNARTLNRHGLHRLRELDWWEKLDYHHLTVCFTPARHFSRRGMFDRNRSLWGSFVIDSPWGKIFFAGDTGYGRFAAAIRAHWGAMDLAFIPIGAYQPRWMMGTVHLNPEEAWQVHDDLAARRSVAIHFGTFQLTDEALAEPVQWLQQIAARRQPADSRDFVVSPFGQSHTLPMARRPQWPGGLPAFCQPAQEIHPCPNKTI